MYLNFECVIHSVQMTRYMLNRFLILLVIKDLKCVSDMIADFTWNVLHMMCYVTRPAFMNM